MRHWLRSNRGFLVFLLVFGFVRTAVADWNPIPSGSMRPTLLEGDVVFVNRLAYDLKLPLTDVILRGLGEPARGEIVTFRSPRDGTRLIKRVVGLPGDVVELRAGVLWLNGTAARYGAPETVTERVGDSLDLPALRADESLLGSERRIQVLPQLRALRDFGPLTVPPGSFFMLGDNRDNSLDSRFYGVVPRDHLIGRAERVLVSADVTGHRLLRWERVGHRLP